MKERAILEQQRQALDAKINALSSSSKGGDININNIEPMIEASSSRVRFLVDQQRESQKGMKLDEMRGKREIEEHGGYNPRTQLHTGPSLLPY